MCTPYAGVKPYAHGELAQVAASDPSTKIITFNSPDASKAVAVSVTRVFAGIWFLVSLIDTVTLGGVLSDVTVTEDTAELAAGTLLSSRKQ